MPISIRFATAADASTILEFIRALAAYEREPDAVEATVETLHAQMTSDRPPFECLLAEDEGVALGFALFFHSYSTWRGATGLYLEDLFVLPEARGRGIGKALLVRLAAIAKQRGSKRMEWIVLDWNRTAIDFYETLGAKPLDGWTVYRLTGDDLDRLASGAN